MSTRNTWSIPIDQLAARAQASLQTVARKIIFELFKAVILRSPVDTGRFRANWNVNVGAADYTTSDAISSSGAQAQAVLTLPFGPLFTLSNGLPYGPRLEFGWSGQAPQGMVRVSLAELSQHVRAALQ